MMRGTRGGFQAGRPFPQHRWYRHWMLRSILSVLAGQAAVGVLVVLTHEVLGNMFPAEYGAGRIPPDRLSALSLATSTLYSVLGGWITVKLAAWVP